MAREIAYERSALAFLRRVPKKVRGQVVQRIEALSKEPHPHGSTKLEGTEDEGRPVYREVSGHYRILYVVSRDRLTVLDIDHRKDVYRHM